jgi:hypothetical protein
MNFYQLLLIFLARKFQKHSKLIITLTSLFIIYKTYPLLIKSNGTTSTETHWSATGNQLTSDVYNDLTLNTSNYLAEYRTARHSYAQFNRRFTKNIPAYAEMKTVVAGGRAASTLHKSRYLVVEYTRVFGDTRFCAPGFNVTGIYLDECPYKNCEFTCDRSLAYEADALLFHEADLYAESVEDMIFLKRTLARHRNRANQVWILWNDEAWRMRRSLNALKFNWVSF